MRIFALAFVAGAFLLQNQATLPQVRWALGALAAALAWGLVPRERPIARALLLVLCGARRRLRLRRVARRGPPRRGASPRAGKHGHRGHRHRRRPAADHRARHALPLRDRGSRARPGHAAGPRLAHLVWRSRHGRRGPAAGGRRGRALAFHGAAEAPARARQPARLRFRGLGAGARPARHGLRACAPSAGAPRRARRRLAVHAAPLARRGARGDARASGRGAAAWRAGGARHRRPGRHLRGRLGCVLAHRRRAPDEHLGACISPCSPRSASPRRTSRGCASRGWRCACRRARPRWWRAWQSRSPTRS